MYCESNIEQACCGCVDIRDDFYEKTVGNAKLLNDYETHVLGVTVKGFIFTQKISYFNTRF